MQQGPVEEDLYRLQEYLGIKFNNIQLLVQALTHRSYLREAEPGVPSNARLEGLGDEVLGIVIHEYLFREFPEASPLVINLWKTELICNPALTRVAESLYLSEYLWRNERYAYSPLWNKRSANALEALFGAVYLDQGLDAARSLIIGLLHDQIRYTVSLPDPRDAREALEELVRSHFAHRGPLVFEKISKGDDPCVVRVRIGAWPICRGDARIPQVAFRTAAWKALHCLSWRVAATDKETSPAVAPELPARPPLLVNGS